MLIGIEVIETNCNLNIEITGITRDSRNIASGNLFAAIPGIKKGSPHGIDYAKEAVKKGAACVLCDLQCPHNLPYVQVKNAQDALAIASENYMGNPAKKLKLIGVTGTNGKTTITNLIKYMLERSGKKCGLIGTIHNMIGSEVVSEGNTTPEAFELAKLFDKMVRFGCEYVIMEVSSHALALGRVYGLNFNIGVFTNLTQDHLDFHGDMENYAAAKVKLFENSDISVINFDDPHARLMLSNAKGEKITYSTHSNDADIVAKNIRLLPDSVEFEALTTGIIRRMHLGIPGEFSVLNALAVVAVCARIGLSYDEISEFLAAASGVCGRAEVVKTKTDYTVMIDYAHTPDALENILKTLRGVANGRIITVFGCGGDRDKTKRPIMGKIASELSDVCIVTSDNPRTEEPYSIIDDILKGVSGFATVIENRREAIGAALDMAREKDIVLLAGKGHETYQEINGVKHHFDEREVVLEHLKKKN
jgi:UDP-N-acetylmuramoyl-L-alanyl-D-glutamate--2,6-diaminopimelate ligase